MKSICYFDESGAKNTEKTIKLARERAQELGIKDVVIASTHGDTGIRAIDAFKDMGMNIIVVTLSKGFTEEGWMMGDERRKELEAKGAKVLTCTHALADNVGSAFTDKFGGRTAGEIVAQTLYRFCQGMKVCVEITLMAADAGFIGVDKDVIAIAGTNRGADTCIVLKPSYTIKILDLKIKEIVAMPR